MEATEIYDEDLPPGLQELKQLIGIVPTLKLVEHYGGLHIKLPVRYNEDNLVGRVVGHENLVKLVDRYGGDTVYIAKADSALRALRNIEISKRYEGGTPANQLAREYGLTERQIWNILKRPETLRVPRPEQSSLF